MLLFIQPINTAALNSSSYIPLQVSIYEPVPTHKSKPQSSVRIPNIQLNGNTLILSSGCDNCLLELVAYDNDESTVFTEYITSGTDTITLPGYLTGEYEIRLTRGNISFYGTINL